MDMSKLLAPFKNWWEGQRERHLFILGTLSFISFSMVMWAIVFFFFLDGAQVEDLDTCVQYLDRLVHWIHRIDFHWPGIYSLSRSMELLDADIEPHFRAELGRERKEAEEAAKTLGAIWSARLKAHYIEHGLLGDVRLQRKRIKRFRILSSIGGRPMIHAYRD